MGETGTPGAEPDAYDLILTSAGPRADKVARVLRSELPGGDVESIMNAFPAVVLERGGYATAEGLRISLAQAGADVELRPVYLPRVVSPQRAAMGAGMQSQRKGTAGVGLLLSAVGLACIGLGVATIVMMIFVWLIPLGGFLGLVGIVMGLRNLALEESDKPIAVLAILIGLVDALIVISLW